MDKRKKLPTLTKKVVLAWMVALFISNLSIGILSYILYSNQLYDTRAIEAKNVATAMAVRVDGDKFSEIMDTLEKNDYWYEVKSYADSVAVVFDTAYIYILDSNYTDEVTYFAEGASDDAPFDLGTTEEIEGVYADEMFQTIRTGVASSTDAYPSGEYGKMVSGFAAITNKSGSVVGVVGVDFFYGDINARLRAFAFSMIAIVAAFLVLCYFAMNYFGTKLVGKPLSDLDDAARQFSFGDMDINLGIKSTTEIGRLASSFTRMIEGVKSQVAALEVLAKGDLTPQVEPRGSKDIMGIAIAQILSSLNDMFSEIKHTADSVSEGARQISDSATSLSQGACDQAEAIERLSSSISDVTDKASENLIIAEKTDKLASGIKSDAQIGSGHMVRMRLAVKEISDASESIRKVIKAIDDIAFQTNILALNAAVEAARAGQHGKGFAVVAEEVRSLASKSAEAAKDSEQLILNSLEKARTGEAIADETIANLDRIIAGVNECASSVSIIAESFNVQISAMTQINRDIDQVSHIVRENSAAAQESAAASQQMKGQADILEDLVAQFQLRDQNLLPSASNQSRNRLR